MLFFICRFALFAPFAYFLTFLARLGHSESYRRGKTTPALVLFCPEQVSGFPLDRPAFAIAIYIALFLLS